MKTLHLIYNLTKTVLFNGRQKEIISIKTTKKFKLIKIFEFQLHISLKSYFQKCKLFLFHN